MNLDNLKITNTNQIIINDSMNAPLLRISVKANSSTI